jgi:hypothetical protein
MTATRLRLRIYVSRLRLRAYTCYAITRPTTTRLLRRIYASCLRLRTYTCYASTPPHLRLVSPPTHQYLQRVYASASTPRISAYAPIPATNLLFLLIFFWRFFFFLLLRTDHNSVQCKIVLIHTWNILFKEMFLFQDALTS